MEKGIHLNLDSLAHSSLRSLDRCAVPFEGLLDFPGQGRFGQCHIVNELFFGNDLHARVILFLVAVVDSQVHVRRLGA
jgi:hypothetical protein